MASLTILMPAYNAAPYIEEAVESLLAQTFKDFELWILDDGSTDQTYQIASHLALRDTRIRICTHQPNRGRVAMVNAKVHQVQSPFFTITDADDISFPDRLEKQMLCLRANPSLMMCGTSYAAINAAGYIIREMRLLSNYEALRARSLEQSPFMGPTTIMRREVLSDFPEFYRAYFRNNMADADLSARILDKYPATNLTEILYLYRILPRSITRSNVSARSLNLHRLIGFLSQQRRSFGKDCLELGNDAEADRFMDSILHEYLEDNSLFHRHSAFFHLYWGQHYLSIQAMIRAVKLKSWHWKNILSLLLIISKVLFISIKHLFRKTHYKSISNLVVDMKFINH